jgi:alkylation response protein AidB-like acyl-CoA dehydrogenase
MFGSGITELVADRFAAFIKERVNPGAAERDEHDRPLSRELMNEAARVGLLPLAFAKDVGGEGMDYGTYGLVLEQVGYHCTDLSFPSLLSLFPDVARVIQDVGRPELNERYVKPMCRGDRFGCFAFTDETDAFNFQSSARKVEGGGCVLAGEKSMQTGGFISDCFLTYVADENQDLSLCLVDRDDPGVEVLPVACLGMRSAGITKLRLTDVQVPPERVLVSHDGLSHAQRFLNSRRIFLICGGTGLLQAMLEECIRILGQTIRYGSSIVELQNVQAGIGRIYVALETARTMLHRALERIHFSKQDPHFDTVVSAAKYYGVEQALVVTQQMMRLLGGKSYTSRLPFQRYLRDFYGGVMGGGTQDILEINLGLEVISAVERRFTKGHEQ